VLLSVLFGLRLSEALGLRWRDVDLTHRQITLHGQLPCDLPHDTKIVVHLEPLKDRDEGETRTFPITEEALPIFLRLRQEQTDQRRLCKLSGIKYYDNDLVCANRTVHRTCKSASLPDLPALCAVPGCRKFVFTICAARQAPICTI